MSKIVRKLRPSDYWRIGEHESWFADMALKGCHLKKVGILFAQFEKGAPKKTKYRIDVATNSITDEEKGLYQESGWEFVTAYGKFNVFSSPEALNAPELHTDAAEQSYTLKALDKRLRQNVAIMSILMVLLLGMLFSVLLLESTPFLSMVTGQFLQQGLLVVSELYVFYTTLRASYSIRIIRKSLAEGRPINHQANWRKNLWRSNIVGVLVIGAACLTIILPLLTIIKSESFTLPEQETSLPIVRLAKVENNPNLVHPSDYVNDGVDRNNRCRYNWSPLATVQYETDEQGGVANEMWKDGSGRYTPSIHTQYYRLTFAGMADGLINDLVKRSLYREDEKLQVISHSGFDKLYLVNGDNSKQIFAYRGKNLIYIRYYGYADTDRIITLVSEKLSKI